MITRQEFEAVCDAARNTTKKFVNIRFEGGIATSFWVDEIGNITDNNFSVQDGTSTTISFEKITKAWAT